MPAFAGATEWLIRATRARRAAGPSSRRLRRLRSGRDEVEVGGGQCAGQLPAGPDPKLGEDVVQMPLHGARAQEQPRRDLRIRQALAGQRRDLSLLRGQVVARLDRTLAHLLAGHLKLSACAIGESLHPDRRELVVGGTELDTRIDPAILAAQPLPVEQMSPGELRTPPGPSQSLDRLAIQALGTLTLTQQCPAARLHSPAPVGAGGSGGSDHLLERTGRDVGLPGADRSFN